MWAIAVVFTGALAASFCDSQDGWDIVWQDDFLGETLNTSNWNIELGQGNSLGRDANLLAANVFLKNGTLVLKSDRDQTGAFNWTSGAVSTSNKAAWSTGRACVKAILPGVAGQSDGIWPAHWMLPVCTALDQATCCWPDFGEIDIMEMINGDNVVHGTYHWSDKYPNTTCQGDAGNAAVSESINTSSWTAAFHEFATEWDESHVLFVFDGIVYANITRTSKVWWVNRTQSPGGSTPFFPQEAMYMLLNTAIGGPWPKPVNAHTQFPVFHVIDYVRVAQKSARALNPI